MTRIDSVESSLPLIGRFGFVSEKAVLLIIRELFIAVFFCFCYQGLSSQTQLKIGIDNLIETDFSMLKGKRIALLTHAAGRTKDYKPTAQIFAQQTQCTLVCLFVPEHGYFGTVPAGNTVLDDTLYGVKVFSLYGSTHRPTREMLRDVDAVVVDLQEIGVRSYTFVSTLYYTLDACAEFGIPCFVLDRPNPLGGEIVDGSLPDPLMMSFVCIVPIPYVYGLTIGELASMMNGEGWLTKRSDGKERSCQLTIVKMKRWARTMTWEDTEMFWCPTSPHIPTVDAVRGYASIGMIGELSRLSTGIGTTLPFQLAGLPGMKGRELEKKLNGLRMPGVKFSYTRFRPLYAKYGGSECSGIGLHFNRSQELRPFKIGIEMLLATRSLVDTLWLDSTMAQKNKSMFNKVTGTTKILDSLLRGAGDTELRSLQTSGLNAYIERRKKYLLYP